MSDADDGQDSLPAPIGLREDPEPRARDVVEASPGSVPGYDPTRRWEAPVSAAGELPTSVRPPEHMTPRRRSVDELRAIDPTITEYDLPAELATDLTRCTPQWFLRDLDRPKEPMQVGPEFLEGTDPRALLESAREEAAGARVLPPRPRVVSASEILAEAGLQHQELVGVEWKATLDDDEPRRYSEQVYPF